MVKGKNSKFIQILKVNLHKLHCFLLLSNLLFFSTEENSSYCYFLQICFSWIRIRLSVLKAAGYGSAFRKTAGSGSAKKKCGSTALLIFNQQQSFFKQNLVFSNFTALESAHLSRRNRAEIEQRHARASRNENNIKPERKVP